MGSHVSTYSIITPACDLGKKQPKKKRVKKLLQTCLEHNRPVRKRLNPGFASEYQPEFLTAFRGICEIYGASNFCCPEKQVLILMLENGIYPCRAERFSEAIIKRLGKGVF